MNNIHKTSNWFLDQLTVFQSANSDSQSIKNNFIIRKTEFSIIIDSILIKKVNDPLQHELILGRRGSGKSTLLKRIEVEIVENPMLNKKYIPIYLAEEQAGIYRLFDLWEQVLEELKLHSKIEISIQEYASFKDNHDYTRYLYTLINEACAKSKKKIILLLDNFDRIVENFDDDGSLLRETLINHNDIQLITGSTRMDEHFWRHDMPFYEFFRRHRLEALSREEINLLLNHWSDSLDIPVLKDFVKNNPGKIENIRILTDGLPRTLQFFIQIVLQKSETTTYEYLKKTMDNVSPLFQERLNALPAQLRKTVLEMSFIWEACTTKQLVEKARMESKLISANLNTLVDKGLVDKIATSKKQHLYRLSERFFNMWLIVTQGNPEQKRKAKWLSIFLENWYDEGDLKRLASEHISKLKKGETDWDHALVFSKALSQSKHISLTERDTIIKLTEKLKCKGSEYCLIELPEKYSEIWKKINKYKENKDYMKAIEEAEKIENEADGVKFFLLGTLYLFSANYPKTEEYLLLAIKKGNTDAFLNLALLYKKQGKYSDAEKYYLIAIEKGNTDALFYLSLLYGIQEKYIEAEKYYLIAIEKGVNDALFNLALLYDNQKKYPEAEKYYLIAIEKGVTDALFNLALLYDNQEKYTDAEKYYLIAMEKGVNDALFNLALLYDNQEKYSEAEKYYLMAIEKGNTEALNNLAIIYENQKKYSEAEKYFLKAIEKDEINALNNMAILYDSQKKYSEAEKFFLIAIEKGVTEAKYNLALSYQNQGKYQDAEKQYLMEIEKGNKKALNNLTVMYYETNTHKAKALEYIYKECHLRDDPDFKENMLIIELWNGIFNDVENRIVSIVKEKNGEKLEGFIIDLLVQQQKTLALKLFKNNELGTILQERYMVLYYVTLLLNNLQDENLKLRIPPELQSTIDEVLRKIETQQQLYSSNKGLF
jgi:TPR repeat protein